MSHIRQREYTPLYIQVLEPRPNRLHWAGARLWNERGGLVAEIPAYRNEQYSLDDAKRLALCWNHHDALLTACRKVLECTSNGSDCTCIENSAVDTVRRAVEDVEEIKRGQSPVMQRQHTRVDRADGRGE